MAIFDVKNFGAKGDGVTDDTVAIQAALDAAKGVPGSTVQMGAGTYIVHGTGDASEGCLLVWSNTTLAGAGMGATTIRLADGSSVKISGIVRTEPSETQEHDIKITNLTVDGNKQHTTGDVDGVMTGFLPHNTKYDYNVTFDAVEVKNVSRIGFNPHEQTHNLTIVNSVAHDNGWDGFTGDYLVDAVFENNVSYNNGRHGFGIVTHTSGMTIRGNEAYGNGADGIVLQKGAEAGANVTNVLVEDNYVHDNAGNGIELKQADNNQIVNNVVANNGKEGIRLDGSSGNLIANNQISLQGGISSATGVAIRDYTGSIPGSKLSHDNVVAYNSITAASSGSGYGLYESTASSGDAFYGNTITGKFKYANVSVHGSQADSGPTNWTLLHNTGDPNSLAMPAPGDANGTANFVAENAGLGTAVGITASAFHRGEAIGFALVNPTGQFAINATTGVVTVAAALDFEAGAARTIRVQATAEDGTTSLAEFSIAIGDSNDNAPVFTSTTAVTVAQGTLDLGAVSAIDADAGPLPTVSIAGELDAARFALSNDRLVFRDAGASLAGVYSVRLLANDGVNITSQVVAVTVTGPTATDPPLPPIPPIPPSPTGATIKGTSGSDVIDGNQAPSGQEKTTQYDDKITGSGGADWISSLGGNDIINGGTGTDTMKGGQGDDSYAVDSRLDVVTEARDGGIDTVKSKVSFTLPDAVENLDLLQGVSINGTGNKLNNIITGNDKANIIDGLAGADTMIGGLGNDTYKVDNVGDRVVETADGGKDTVVTTLTDYALAANVENLTFAGVGNFRGIGNGLGNIITAGNGTNILDGGLGADTMIGGSGKDTYFVDSAKDDVREKADAGRDMVVTTLTKYSLVANVETLRYAGDAAFRGTGNTLANAILGGNGNDILNGGAGPDTLTGGAGSDTFVFKAGQAYHDVITDFVVGQDSLRFVDFGRASITQLDDTDFYIIRGDAAHHHITESIQIVGVHSLELVV